MHYVSLTYIHVAAVFTEKSENPRRILTRFSTNVACMQRDALKHRAPSCFLAGGHEGRARPWRESCGDCGLVEIVKFVIKLSIIDRRPLTSSR